VDVYVYFEDGVIRYFAPAVKLQLRPGIICCDRKVENNEGAEKFPIME
jgi:hypothetical protein